MRLFPSSCQEQILNSTVVMEFTDQRTARGLIPALSQAKGFSTNSVCWSIPSVEKPAGGGGSMTDPLQGSFLIFSLGMRDFAHHGAALCIFP